MIRIYGFRLGFRCTELHSNGRFKLIKRDTMVRMIRTIDKEISKYLRRMNRVPLFDIIQHVFV